MSDLPEGIDPTIVLPDDPSFGPEVQIDYPGYRSTRWRAPSRPLVTLPEELHALEGPVFGEGTVEERERDLTIQHPGEPIGERIIVSGRLLDEDGRPLRGALVEVWQANAAGRYHHDVDQHPAPLDPNFTGAGRCLTDDRGPLPLHHRQAGLVPVGEPRERLAAGPHPLLGLRPSLPRAARDADVLPGGPAVPVRSHLQLDQGSPLARAPGCALRPADDSAAMGALVRMGHRPRPRRPRGDADRGRLREPRRNTIPDRRPLLRDRAVPRARQRARACRTTRGRSRSWELSSTVRESRSRDGMIELWDRGRGGGGEDAERTLPGRSPSSSPSLQPPPVRPTSR